MLTRALAVLAVFVAACSGQKPRLLHPGDPSTDFYSVSPGIYRGGRLDEGGVLRLQKLGVKTILNLENDGSALALEAKWAKAASIAQVSSPLSGEWTPNDAPVDRILKLLAACGGDPVRHTPMPRHTPMRRAIQPPTRPRMRATRVRSLAR